MERAAVALVVAVALSCGGRTETEAIGPDGIPGSGGAMTSGSGGSGTGGVFGIGGTTSTGGWTATGGVSVGGFAGSPIGSPGDACFGRDAIGYGTDGLIDDLEDGDEFTRTADRRSGVWWTAAGDGCIVTPTPGFAALPSPAAGDNHSFYAMRVAGSACSASAWGFQAGLILNLVDGYACAYNAAVYDGLQFWAIGLGIQLQLQVAERGTIPEIYGGDGTCDGNRGDTVGCWDNYAVTFGLSGQWALYSLSWSALKQAGWGTQVPFDTTKLSEVIFQISPDQAMTRTATFVVDDVRFYRGSPDPTPPMPGMP